MSCSIARLKSPTHNGRGAPEPPPASPATTYNRSRSESPAVPLNETDHASYGAARRRQVVCEQAAASEDDALDVNGPSNNHLNNHQNGRKSWIEWMRSFSLYLELENSGSVARDHLASERTFLAYVRTGLAIASAGVALVQLFSVSSDSSSSERIKAQLLSVARPLGAVIVLTGVVVHLIGIRRYFDVQAALITGNFPPARLTIIFISTAIALLVSIVFGFLVHASR